MITTTAQLITPEILANAYNYSEYSDLMSTLTKEKKTSGSKQSDSLIGYTKLNYLRMKRIYKTTVIDDVLTDRAQSIDKPVIWLVLVESWCGDVAQNLPVLARVAELSEHIDLRIILRDENPDIMNAFLTNGGRAIPKLVILDAHTLEEMGTWGPRPAPFQKMAMDQKANPIMTYAEFSELVQRKYLDDRTETIQKELTELLRKL